jgi:hypothetical protein
MLSEGWECVLEYFRDSRPASLRIDVSTDYGEPPGEAYTDEITLLGDGSAIVNRISFSKMPDGDEGDGFGPWYHVSLKPPEFFDACIVAGTPDGAVTCFLEWQAAELCTPVSCCPESRGSLAPPECG